MPEFKFRIQHRFKEFLQRIQKNQLFSSQFLLYITGWLFLYFAVASSLKSINFTIIPLLLILFYFWHKLLNDLYNKFKPPSEFSIFLLLIFLILENTFFQNYSPAITALPNGGDPGFLALAFQIFLLACTTLILSLLLVESNEGKHGVIYTFILVGVISVFLDNGLSRMYWIIYQFILVLFLFKRTRWLEKLTKSELWIYFFVFFVMFYQFDNLYPFPYEANASSAGYAWFQIPRYIFLLSKYFILAALIRIPFVMVYNHASLARKLRIAGLFQSNFPQFIQLIFLLVFFYFFIAGWQAGNLQESIQQEIYHGKSSAGDFSVKFSTGQRSVDAPGFRPIAWPEDPPEEGVISLTRTGAEESGGSAEFYAFHWDAARDSAVIHFKKIDQNLLDAVCRQTPVFAASHVSVYPFQITGWDSLFYEMKFYGINSESSGFKIFPFAFFPYQDESDLSAPIGDFFAQKNAPGATFKLFNRSVFTLGRVYATRYDQNFQPKGYLTFDINLLFSWKLVQSSIGKQMLLWFFIYLLANALIIRQVVRFGDQIHDIIIQKFDLLKKGIREISTGNLDYRIDLEGEDEFVELGDRFNRMSVRLKDTIDEAREKERLQYELKIARDVQLSLLPHQLPKIPGYQLAATIRTAVEVGGDFYDTIPLDDDKYLLIIGDISGKGTSAAFYMAQCISLLRYSRQFTSDPREILLRLNQYFSSTDMDRQVFLTAIIALLDAKKNRVQLFRAGHNRPYFLSHDPNTLLEEIDSGGIGIGLDREGAIFKQSLKVKRLSMRVGDSLILYTDGVVEAAKKNGETDKNSPRFYGEERLKKLLSDNRDLDARLILDVVMNDLTEFYRDDAFVDDSSILILKRNGDAPKPENDPAT